MNEGICIRGLRKSFEDHLVLDGVDLDIPRGQQRVILGRSGQGKSVLLKLMVGLLDPEAGSVTVDGEEVPRGSLKKLYRMRRKFSMVFQGGALFDSMTIGENVCLGLVEHSGHPTSEIERRGSRALEMVGLAGIEHKYPSELSGGMKKRASVARAIVTEPEYLLYDEPTTGLDPITADAMNRLIQQLAAELGVTSIVVTHDMRSAFTIGTRFALLNNGSIVFEGSSEEARADTDGPMAQFIAGTAEGPLDSF
jgi:phospholipid/cholesterol/gamma-HCH transport system ATP-binding protein